MQLFGSGTTAAGAIKIPRELQWKTAHSNWMTALPIAAKDDVNTHE
jgi:hypothetical protein